jgi:hypothetical protein
LKQFHHSEEKFLYLMLFNFYDVNGMTMFQPPVDEQKFEGSFVMMPAVKSRRGSFPVVRECEYRIHIRPAGGRGFFF